MLALALLSVAFFIVRPHGTPGPAMRDFEAFYAAGSVANLGEDPYGRAIWDGEKTIPGVNAAHDEMLPFVGPPAVLPFWRALAKLPYVDAGRVWGAMLAVAMLVLVFGSLALAGAPQNIVTALGAAIFAGGFGPLTSDVALGQFALVSAAAVVATLQVLRTQAWPAASLASAMAALQPNLGLVLIARLSDWRALVAFATGAVIFAAAMLAQGGIGGFAGYLHLLAVHGAAEASTVIQITPAGIAFGFGASSGVAKSIGTGVGLLAMLFAAFAIRRIDDAIARVGIAACALPFVVPFFHEHDFVLAILPATICAIRARGNSLGFAAVAATACGVDWLGLGQRPNAEAQSIVLACACALGFALAAELRREAFFALVVPVAVALVAAIARTHPVPIWPDELPVTWRAPAGASVSEIWGMEQRLAGLDAIDPVWGVLRALSLLSSALLGVALYVTTASDVDVHEIVERRERARMEAV